MSYLRRMNSDVGSQFSVGQLIAWALGATLLGALLAVVLACVLHGVLHALGAFQTHRGVERKFSLWLALFAVGVCAVVGGLKGMAIGAARAAVAVARDVGPRMAEEGVQNALRQSGLTNFMQLDVTKLRGLVDQAGSAPLPPLERLERFRPQIEEARAKLLPAAKALLDTHAQGGTLDLKEAVAAFWPKVLAEMVAWERIFRGAMIAAGVLGVVGVEVAIALVCLVTRFVRQPLAAKPPTLPKSESWQPKPN